jgi:hypothetical protein
MKNLVVILFCFCLPLVSVAQEEFIFANKKAKKVLTESTIQTDSLEFVVFQFNEKTSTDEAYCEIMDADLRPATPAELAYYVLNIDSCFAVLSPKPILIRKRLVVFGIYQNYVSLSPFVGKNWCEDIIFLAVKK